MNILEKLISSKDLYSKLKNNSSLKNGILFTIFAFLSNGINFLILITLAGYLSPDGYGQLNLFTTFITIFSVLIPLGTTGFVAVSFFRKTKEELRDVINIIFFISSFILILILFILIFGGTLLEKMIGFSNEYQIIALLICFFQIFNLINLEIWRLEEKPIKYGIYSFGIAFFNFILTFIFVLLFKMDWTGRVYAQLAIAIIFFSISIYILIHRKYFILRKINIPLLKETLSFGVPLIPHQITSWIRQGLDRYIINFFIGTTSVGLFSFAFNFGNIIHMVGIAFNASNSVFIYKNLSDKTDATRNKLYKQTCFMSLFFFILTIIVFCGAYYLIPYIFPKYKESLPFLFPICLGAFFQCNYYLFVNYLFYYKKTKGLMYITTTISVLHLLLSFLFTRYSTLYTAYITLFSNFAICLLVILYSQKIYPLIKYKKE